MNIKENQYNIIFAVENLFFFILCMFFVPTSDDLFYAYDFPYHTFGELIHQTFYYGNGRLLANFMGLFFSHHTQLFYILEALLVPLFAILTEKLTELKNSKILVVAFIATIPLWQFKGLFAWMCAFINYFVPIIFFVITLLIIKNNLYIKHKTYYLILFILGFCEQFFVEHNTIINTLFALIILIYSLKNLLSSVKPAIVLFVSNISGAIIMFTYKLYIDYSQTHIGNNLTTYRKTVLTYIENGGIKNGIKFMMQQGKYFAMTLSCSAFLVIILLAVMISVEQKSQTKMVKHKSVFIITFVSYAILFSLSTYNFIVFDNDIPDNKKTFALLLMVFFGLTFVLITILFFKTIIKRMNIRQKSKIYVLLGFALLSFVPFLLVHPYLYRCAFLSLFFIMLALIYIIKFAKEEYECNIEKLYDTVFIIAGIVMIIYTGLYAREKKIFNYKTEYYKTSYYLPASDENVIHYPNEEFWIKHSGMEHEFIALEEFESMLADNNNQ